MKKDVFQRHEKKYLLDEERYRLFIKRMEPWMQQDSHFDYTICNLYLDTTDDYYIRQSLSGPVYKEKLRLRSYGTPNENDKVYLELKKKYRGVVYKRRSPLTLRDAGLFCSGRTVPGQGNAQVLREIGRFLAIRPVEPRVYLSYDRKAFSARDGSDLRITFDHNIITRRFDLKLESGSCGAPLLREGIRLMEIKLPLGMPMWLASLLSRLEISSVGFSKYGAEYQRYLAASGKGGAMSCLKPSLAANLMPLSSPAPARCLAS